MILIDTSCWIEALRKNGDPAIKAKVHMLLINDQAAWCPMIQLELWNGVSKIEERQYLEDLSLIHHLELNPVVWTLAFELVQKCRQKGTPVPSTDALIVACARTHQVEVLHNDKHFDTLLAVAS